MNGEMPIRGATVVSSHASFHNARSKIPFSNLLAVVCDFADRLDIGNGAGHSLARRPAAAESTQAVES